MGMAWSFRQHVMRVFRDEGDGYFILCWIRIGREWVGGI